MGIDVSVLVTDVPPPSVLALARHIYPAGLAFLLVGSVPSDWNGLSALSIWADRDLSLDPLSAVVSTHTARSILVLTGCDHSCVGGAQLFAHGALAWQEWTEGSQYLVPLRSGLAAFGLGSAGTDPLLLERLTWPQSGFVIHGSGIYQQGAALSPVELRAVLEDDLGTNSVACLLAGAV